VENTLLDLQKNLKMVLPIICWERGKLPNWLFWYR